MKNLALVLSCEHAVNTVPETYQALFAPYQKLLNTHRGIDLGSLGIANGFYQAFNCDFVVAEVTRLLIDCNRSLKHRQHFSEISSLLPSSEKEELIQRYYLPYRQKVEDFIKQHIQEGKQVLHLSIHSFTPRFNEIERQVDIGLLYDPKRSSESSLAKPWLKLIKKNCGLKAYANRPYRGISDGFTTELRKKFSNENYAGIEIETNQKLLLNEKKINYLAEIYIKSLKILINPV